MYEIKMIGYKFNLFSNCIDCVKIPVIFNCPLALKYTQMC